MAAEPTPERALARKRTCMPCLRGNHAACTTPATCEHLDCDTSVATPDQPAGPIPTAGPPSLRQRVVALLEDEDGRWLGNAGDIARALGIPEKAGQMSAVLSTMAKADQLVRFPSHPGAVPTHMWLPNAELPDGWLPDPSTAPEPELAAPVVEGPEPAAADDVRVLDLGPVIDAAKAAHPGAEVTVQVGMAGGGHGGGGSGQAPAASSGAAGAGGRGGWASPPIMPAPHAEPDPTARVAGKLVVTLGCGGTMELHLADVSVPEAQRVLGILVAQLGLLG